MLTEDQAKTKWCPHARAGDNHSEYRVAVNRCGNSPDVDCFCMASACMAWRWEAYRGAKLDGERRGYCGAFGIPMESIV
jgi:hypothetical protein